MWPFIHYSILTFILVIYSLHSVNGSYKDMKNDYLIVANLTSIYKFDDVTNKSSSITHLPIDHQVTVLDYSFEDGLVFWSSSLDFQINVHDLKTGKNIDLIKNQPPLTHRFAIDWINKKIYTIQREPYRIEVSNYDGSNSSVIFVIPPYQIPRCIGLAPLNGILFWSDFETSTINRISMNGDQKTIRKIIDNTKADAFAFDHNLKRIFWTDFIAGRLKYADFDGHHLREIQQAQTATISLHNSIVYYTQASTQTIDSIDYIGGKKRTLIKYNDYRPLLNYVSSQNQPNRTSNPCSHNNGGCSNLCLLSSEPPNYYSCACPTGLLLHTDDNKTCKSFPDHFLLIAFAKQIDYVSLDANLFLPKPTGLNDQHQITSIDFDPVEQRIYWIDENKVKSAALNGTDQRLVIDSEHTYERLKLDTKNRNIYLVKNSMTQSKNLHKKNSPFPSNNSIEVISMNGGFKKTLINDYIDAPRAIAIDERNQFFYWSDWGQEAKIEKVSFDLKIRKVIINENIFWPNGIVIDVPNERLYWCEAKLQLIEFSDLNGMNRRKFYQLEVPSRDLTLLGDHIYYIDEMNDQIGRIHKLYGTNEMISYRNQKLDKIMAFTAVFNGVNNHIQQVSRNIETLNCDQMRLNDNLCTCADGWTLQADNKTCLLGNSLCEISNGDCDQICTPIVGNYHKCSCNEGFYLDQDQKKCHPILPVMPLSSCDQITNPCSHVCFLIDGKPSCSCPNGMHLHKNGKNCMMSSLPFGLDDSQLAVTISSNDLWKEPSKEHSFSFLQIAIISLLFVLLGFTLLLAYFAIKQRKTKNFTNSKEHFIPDNITNVADQGSSEYSHSPSSNADNNAILCDRSLGVGASVLDENRSLFDTGSCDNMSSVSKQYYRRRKQFEQRQRDSSRFHDHQRSKEFDESTENDAASDIDYDIRANELISKYLNSNCHYVPPPTPHCSDLDTKDEDGRLYDDHRILNNFRKQPLRQSPLDLNFKDDLASKDFVNHHYTAKDGDCAFPIDIPTMSASNYMPMQNPPNSLSSSVNNLNVFKTSDD